MDTRVGSLVGKITDWLHFRRMEKRAEGKMWASGGRIRGKTTRMVERAVENRRCVRTTLPSLLHFGHEMRYFMFTIPTGMPYA